jgi:uncharacterized damage-inducible protein DinB
MTDTPSGATRLERARETLAEVWETESATTLKVLRAYPADQAELRPHERSKTARELAWMFPLEMKLSAAAVRGKMSLSGGMPPAPGTLEEVLASFEAARADLLEALRGASDEQLGATVPFPTGPKQIGEWPVVEFLWFLLHDHIHHRGQLSVYLRMSGAKVPSIYGPSADEPWF